MATRRQLEDAFINADKAGDTEAARELFGALQAQEYTDAETRIPFEGALDRKRGAPPSVRSAVASAPTQQDKMTALKSFYPDIQPYQDDNYVFTDPETNRPTLYNPEGMDLGDVAEFGRGGAELLGGAIGASSAALLGQLGPQVATPEELVTVPLAAGLGATAAVNLYDMAARSTFGIPDTRSAMRTLGDYGTTIVVNAVGQIAGDVASQYIQNLVKGAGSYIGKTSIEIRDAFARIDAEPTAGAISQSESIQGIEQGLSKLPLAADIIGKQYRGTVDAMDDFAIKTARQLSTKTGPEEVGRSIDKGINTFTNKFKSQATTLYNNLWTKLPQDKRVGIDNFNSSLDDLVGQFGDDPAFQGLLDSPIIKKLSEAATEAVEGTGGVTVKTLKALRTKIGNELDNKSLLTDTTNAELKKLYGALSDDMKVAAEEAGALNQFTRANKYWAAGRSRIDEVLDPIASSVQSEKIYNKVFGRDGKILKNIGTENIRTLMKSLPKSAQKDVTSEFIRRLSMKTPGTSGFEEIGTSFNPGRYIKQYNDMPDGAKKAIFDRVPGLRSATDDLATTSAAINETFKMANNSGTAGQLVFMSLLTGGIGIGGAYGGTTGGALAGAGAIFSPVLAAKIMTNPKFVRWLAGAGDVVISDPNSIGAFIGRLTAIAEGEPAIAEYAKNLNDAFRAPPERQQQPAQ